jgi:hypothetical protein
LKDPNDKKEAYLLCVDILGGTDLRKKIDKKENYLSVN